MELITIIVPVYQVEAYLDDCIKSLINQTYTNIEILLIDDGSTDKSGQICDEYAQKDKRIKVIHQKYKGVSGARNTGLKKAGGEYVAFVDSDDIVSKEYIKVLYSILKENEADISICNYLRSEKADVAMLDINANFHKVTCIDSKKFLKQWHGKHKKIETMVWNKLYHKSIFQDNIYFPEGKIHEDTYISHLMISNAHKIVLTEQKLYIYRVRKGSITKSKATKESIRQDLDAQKARMKYFKDRHMYGSYLRCLKGHLLHRVKYIVNKSIVFQSVI